MSGLSLEFLTCIQCFPWLSPSRPFSPTPDSHRLSSFPELNCCCTQFFIFSPPFLRSALVEFLLSKGYSRHVASYTEHWCHPVFQLLPSSDTPVFGARLAVLPAACSQSHLSCFCLLLERGCCLISDSVSSLKKLASQRCLSGLQREAYPGSQVLSSLAYCLKFFSIAVTTP